MKISNSFETFEIFDNFEIFETFEILEQDIRRKGILPFQASTRIARFNLGVSHPLI